MSDRVLTSLPSVSWPGLPCGYGVAINDGAGRWVCVAENTPCSAGTTLYVSPPEPYVWRFCAPHDSLPEIISKLGPNQAVLEATPVPTPGPTPAFTRTPTCLVCATPTPTPGAAPAPVPAFDLWAVAVVIGALAFAGWWKTK